jgi:hypothetical protein
MTKSVELIVPSNNVPTRPINRNLRDDEVNTFLTKIANTKSLTFMKKATKSPLSWDFPAKHLVNVFSSTSPMLSLLHNSSKTLVGSSDAEFMNLIFAALTILASALEMIVEGQKSWIRQPFERAANWKGTFSVKDESKRVKNLIILITVPSDVVKSMTSLITSFALSN